MVILEDHRRGAVRLAHLVDQARERIGEPAALGGSEALEGLDDLLLRDRRRLLRDRAAQLGQSQDQPPRIAFVAVAGDVAALHEPRHDDRDGALIGERPFGELGQRQRRRFSELVQNEQLRAGQAELALRRTVGEAQQPDQAADGVEDSLCISQFECLEYQTLYARRVQKRYDRAYFDRWYRGRARIGPEPDVRRKVSIALAATEYVLRRTARNAIDIGCGEAPWFTHLAALRPKIRYAGFDPSDYAVREFGASRNVRRGSFGDLGALNIRERFDLVVCADVLHYLDEHEMRRGLPVMVKLMRGAAYVEVLTREDDVVGDTAGFFRRPASWYREQLANAGLTQIAPYLWIGRKLASNLAALERT
jgi:SAM-dependent methyltransferase